MKTKTITVYKFSELSDEAKERVRQEYFMTDFPWQSGYEDTLNAFCDFFNLSWTEYDFSYQKFVRWNSKNNEEIDELTGKSLLEYIKEKNKEGSKYGKELLDGSCPFTGYCGDEDILDPLRLYLKEKTEMTTFLDLMEECFDSFINAMSRDYEYFISDEAIEEMSDANEYEYLESGDFAHCL